MLLYSFRFNRKLRHTALLLLLLLAVMTAGRLVMAFSPEQASASSTIKRRPAKTEEQRQQFMAELGWQVKPEPDEAVEVVIPKKFDDVYQSYNAIQKEQGTDLSRYRGKRCKRYSYTVLNHPSGLDNIRLDLLVCGGRVIGGDVCSLGLDGFLQGLSFPQENIAQSG